MSGKDSGGIELSDQEKGLIGQQTDLLKFAEQIVRGGFGDFQGNRDQLFNLAGFSTTPDPKAAKFTQRAEKLKKENEALRANNKSLNSAQKRQIADNEKKIARFETKATSLGQITPTGPTELDFARTPGSQMPLLGNLNRQVFNTLTQNLKQFDPNRPDPFVEEQLRLAREQETERLASRLGPGADVSSAGLESLSKLGLNETLSRDAARRRNYADQLQQFQTLGTLGMQTSGELFNRRQGLRQETNQNVLANEGFRQQRLSELSTLLQQPLAFAGPLGGVAQGFSSPLAAYSGARQTGTGGPSAGQTLGSAAGGAISGAALGAPMGPWGIAGGTLAGGAAGLLGGGLF